MPIRPCDIPNILIERIEATHPRPGTFGVHEIDDWPDGSLAALLLMGILHVQTTRAQAIVCPGCEWNCVKSVIARRSKDQKLRAFIVCDEEQEYGRVSVALRLLSQFEVSLQSISEAVARALKLDAPRQLPSGNTFVLGQWKGRNGYRQVQVGLDGGQLLLGVGHQREPLCRVATWSPSGLKIDEHAVRRLADRKGRAQNTEQFHAPDRSAQQKRSRKTRKRDIALFREAKRLHAKGGTWSDAARALAGTKFAPDLEWTSVRRIITAQSRLERK